MDMVPFGFRFNPTDEELIQILEQKVFHNACHLDFITETNIYDNEPQHLQWDETTVAVNKGEKYYFCRREVESREVARRGWWKATSHVKTIYGHHHHRRVLGFKRPLTFHKFNKEDIGGRRRNNPIKTDWIMHEYTLRLDVTEWRLCRIKYKGKLQATSQQVQQQCSNQYSDCGGASSTTSQHLDSHAGLWPQPAVPMNVFDLSISECEFVDSILDQQYSFPDLLGLTEIDSMHVSN